MKKKSLAYSFERRRDEMCEKLVKVFKTFHKCSSRLIFAAHRRVCRKSFSPETYSAAAVKQRLSFMIFVRKLLSETTFYFSLQKFPSMRQSEESEFRRKSKANIKHCCRNMWRKFNRYSNPTTKPNSLEAGGGMQRCEKGFICFILPWKNYTGTHRR